MDSVVRGGSINWSDDPQFFGPPSLVLGEDAKAYNKLASLIAGAVKPIDYLEYIWVRDMISLEWDILRHRRIKAEIINGAKIEALKVLLVPLMASAVFEDDERVAFLAQKWANGDPAAVREVKTRLESAGLTEENIAAEAFLIRMDAVVRIDRTIAGMELRRNNAYRETQRHRIIGKTLREAVEQIEAEVLEIDQQPPERKEAA